MGFKNILKSSLSLIFILWSFSIVNAWELHHFEVKLSPEKAKVGEALDLEIKAVDENNNIVNDYVWSVLIFSDTNPEVELPIALDNSIYKFTNSDQWKVKFENWIKFMEKWVQSLNIYDYDNDEKFWKAEVEITEEEKDKKVEIDILNPEQGTTIANDFTEVSWTTKKNHKVKIMINDKEYETTSNSNWVYKMEIKWLRLWENTIKSQVLDADQKIVWESKEIKIKVENSNIIFKNIKLIPEEVFTEALYEVEVNASPDLKKVDLIVNDELLSLEEKEDGVYIWKSYAPKEKWTYSIDLDLSSELWHKKQIPWVASLKVNEFKSATETWVVEKEETPKEEKQEEPKEEVVKEKLCKKENLEIKWLKIVELKTKSILTWDKLENINSYKIYKKNKEWGFDFVKDVSEPKFEIEIDDKAKKVTYEFFAVKAVCEEDWETYEWDLSEATKVKTGPELFIILIISLFLWWLFFVFNFKKKEA